MIQVSRSSLGRYAPRLLGSNARRSFGEIQIQRSRDHFRFPSGYLRPEAQNLYEGEYVKWLVVWRYACPALRIPSRHMHVRFLDCSIQEWWESRRGRGRRGRGRRGICRRGSRAVQFESCVRTALNTPAAPAPQLPLPHPPLRHSLPPSAPPPYSPAPRASAAPRLSPTP